MAHFEIIVGTVLGASEYVADALKETLENFNHSADIHLDANLETLNQSSTWVICTSTHGAGDLPDNIVPFAQQLKQHTFDDLKFLIVGLGDSSYDTYCNGAMTMQDLMEQSGATLLNKPIHIDVLNHPIPEDKAVEWLTAWLEKAD